MKIGDEIRVRGYYQSVYQRCRLANFRCEDPPFVFQLEDLRDGTTIVKRVKPKVATAP